MAVADNFDPKRPTHIIDGVQDRLANGTTAGTPIPVAEIEINDVLILVESQDRTTGAVADLTDEFTIEVAGQIVNDGGGTDTTGDNLYVRFFDRDWKEQTFFLPG